MALELFARRATSTWAACVRQGVQFQVILPCRAECVSVEVETHRDPIVIAERVVAALASKGG